MTAALVLAVSTIAALAGALVWAVYRVDRYASRVATELRLRMDEGRAAARTVEELADARDLATVAHAQAAADLAAESKAHALTRLTLERTARELGAALKELTDAHRANLDGLDGDELAAAVERMLQARLDAEDARDRAVAGDGGGGPPSPVAPPVP